LLQHACEDATLHFERALDILRYGAARLPRAESEIAHCRLLFHLGDAQRRCGSFTRAKTTFRGCARLAKEMAQRGDTEGSIWFAHAALGCAVTQSTVEALQDTSVLPILEESLTLLPSDASALRARLMARLAWALSARPQSKERREKLSND